MTESFDRAAIKARAEAATPGPWDTSTTSWEPEALMVDMPDGADDVYSLAWHAGGGLCVMSAADAEFIAHAREDIPALLAALEEAERRIAAVEAAIANQPVFANDGYGGLRMYGHADFMTDLLAALHPVAETTEPKEA